MPGKGLPYRSEMIYWDSKRPCCPNMTRFGVFAGSTVSGRWVLPAATAGGRPRDTETNTWRPHVPMRRRERSGGHPELPSCGVPARPRIIKHPVTQLAIFCYRRTVQQQPAPAPSGAGFSFYLSYERFQWGSLLASRSRRYSRRLRELAAR